MQNRTILCAIQNNTLCNKSSNNTVQNFVQSFTKSVQKICAILFYYQKVVQYFVKKSAILAMLAIQKNYCTVFELHYNLHILLNFVNRHVELHSNIGTTWFADDLRECPLGRVSPAPEGTSRTTAGK